MNWCQGPLLAAVDNSGSSLRWQVDLGHQRHRFPITHGFYNIAVKLLVVKGLTADSQILHLCTDPPIIAPTYRDEKRAVLQALRSFVLHEDQIDHFTVDCSGSMEYYQLNMSSQPYLNVMLLDDRGQKLDKVTGHVLFYIQEL